MQDESARQGQHGTRYRRGIVAALCMALLVAATAAWTARSQAPARAAAATASPDAVTVSVDLTGKPAGSITHQFIGLSFESSTLNNGYRYDNVGNLAQLLRNLGSSIMRFGGDSADTSYADTNAKVLDSVDRLAKASGWSVLWSENLLHFNAARVTTDANALSSTLGSSLFAIACGNEPDMYIYGGLRPPTYTVADYVAAASTCYRAIHKGAAKAPIEGPDTAWNPQWLAAYSAKEAGAVRAVGQHYYPLSCVTATASPTAYLSTLLSTRLAATEVKKITGYVAAARPAHAPLLLTETNSACGGGVRGLSDAYASALWAIDFMLTGAQLGIHAMTFHGGLNTLCGGYTVLCQVGTAAYRPQPIYYGMLLTHLLGTGRFLPVTVTGADKAGHLAAFALKPPSGGKQRILLDNLSARSASTALRVGGYRGPAGVLRLAAPSPLSTSGVTVQGATVAADGTLKPGAPHTVQCTAAGCQVVMPPYSAALVTLG